MNIYRVYYNFNRISFFIKKIKTIIFNELYEIYKNYFLVMNFKLRLLINFW